MNKRIAALAVALTLVGSLTACGNRDSNANGGNNAGTASGANGSATTGTNGGNASGANSGITSGPDGSGTTGAGTGTGSGTASTVRRSHGGRPVYGGNSYWDDGRYTAGSNGQVYGMDDSGISRDLTRDARDIVRDAGDALEGVGRSITGSDAYPGTPSWEPDSSARF